VFIFGSDDIGDRRIVAAARPSDFVIVFTCFFLLVDGLLLPAAF